MSPLLLVALAAPALAQELPTAPAPAPLAAAPAVDAEAPAAAEGLVSEVRIAGLRRVEEAALRAVIGLRVGDRLQPWMIQRDIKAIWRSGFVEDVRVDIQPAMPGTGVAVVFTVDEKPAVREVRLKGNKKLDEESLMEVVDITSFSVLNEVEVKRNTQRLREKYVEKGYYLVQIEPVVTEAPGDQVDLTFEITEGRKVIVQRIDITGNESLPDRKVRRYLQTKQGGAIPWLTSSGTFNEANLENDAQIVRSVYLEEGYVDVVVDEPKVYLSPDKRSIFISIHVTEGPQYLLGAIKVEGDFVTEEGLTPAAARQIISGDKARTVRARWERAGGVPADDRHPAVAAKEGWEDAFDGLLVFNEKNPEMKTGDIFKLSTFQTIMAELTDYYGDQGYAFANVIPNTATDPDAKVVDVTFNIERGEKVRIGRIDITGNDPTWDKVVRREIPIYEGDIYRSSAVREARARLDRLGYFDEPKITTPRGDGDDVLDMKVEVTEQPTGTFSVGAGFSNLENFMFTTNVSKNNFLGLGYVMRAEANLSAKRQQWNLSFFDPYFLDSRWTLKVDGFSIARQYIEDEYQRGGSLSVGRYLDQRDDVRLNLDYTFQDTGLNTIDPYKSRLLGGELYRNGLTSTVGLSLNADKRNNRINATRGVFATVSADLSGGFRLNDEEVLDLLGGDFNFAEFKGNVRTYYPVIQKEDRLVFKYNGTLGAIVSTDGSVVPYIHRYRAGGINSVRGYDWYSLGPSIRASGYRNGAATGSSQSTFVGSDDPASSEDKLVVGGTQTWINNFELEAPIIKAAGISAVVFFDAGNAFGDPWGEGGINPLDLRLGYGAGIRWFSPMGPLRFEWGFPVNPREDERRAVFDFSIGSLF